MTAVETYHESQTVWLGEPGDPLRKTTWTILSLRQAAEGLVYATIRSGQYGITKTVPTTRLTPFRVAEEAA